MLLMDSMMDLETVDDAYRDENLHECLREGAKREQSASATIDAFVAAATRNLKNARGKTKM